MFAEAMSSLFASPAPRRHVNATLENPAFSLNDPAAYEYLGGGSKSASGVVVTHENSLMIAAVYQAVSLISGDVSRLPLYPHRRLPEDDREIDSKHPAYFAAAVRANPFKSAKRFWRDLMVHSLIFTNGYGYISRRSGKIELYNLLPDRTAPEWLEIPGAGTQLVYVTEVNGEIETLYASQVLHIRGISLDGKEGADLTKCARDAWGLALAAQNFTSKFFKNGARMGGTLELPIALTKQARDTVEEGFRKSYEDGDNPFKTVILREGAKFHAGQVTPQEGEVSALRDEQKREVASYFNLPPSKLGIRDSVSYNSFEQEALAYKEGCLSHWTGDIADECDMKLLTESELRNDTHYFEHNYSRFGQADTKTLNETLEIQRRNEIINADEWRRKLNMNKRPDGKGGEYINPNTRSADSQKPKEESANSNSYENLRNELHTAFGDLPSRIVNEMVPHFKSHADSLNGGLKFIEELYRVGTAENTSQTKLFVDRIVALSGELRGDIGKAADNLASLDAVSRETLHAVVNEKLRQHDERVIESLAELLTDNISRIARRATRDVREASKKPEKFKDWAAKNLVTKSHSAVLEEAVRPIANALQMAFPGRFDAQSICNEAQQQLLGGLLDTVKSLGTIEANHLESKVNERMQDFERTSGKLITPVLLRNKNV